MDDSGSLMDSCSVLISASDFEDDEVESSTSSSTTNISSSTSSTALTVIYEWTSCTEIARKRKVRTNPPPSKGKGRSCSRGHCDPKSVTPAQRVKEHPS